LYYGVGGVTISYDYDETYGFGTFSAAQAQFRYYCSNASSGDQVVNEPTANGNAPDWQWTDDEGSPSTSTGPPTTPTDGCVFPESSTPMANGDISTATLFSGLEADASAYNLIVTAKICRYGNASGNMYIDAYNGSTWTNLATWAGNASQTWVDVGPWYCSGYENTDFRVRFRVVNGGTTYQNDFAVSQFRIYGNSKTLYEISGATLDKDGDPLYPCQVHLLRDNGDDTATWLAHTESSGTSGSFSFQGAYSGAEHFLISWKDDTPHVFDASDHNISGAEVV
jgi:hypothetical protein